ncbi:Permease of the drug/metabolite transporter (DMT) superfamily [Paenibacillus aquistagni]|uniref:Permease of the drug/metabolite transporter (DMT) superfamily n=2 Tax=Paenibacillus aquistagni TaxID=1852522 RepID=A0A1X7J1W5_9BACL|nr:Permease of the drug/metabolite transporter (DMT) superfamily [Paenibacillus aquistagni]
MTIAMTTVGSSFVVGKWITESFPVFLASGLRYGLASALMLIILFLIEKPFPKLTGKHVATLLLLSLTGVFGFSVLLLYGVQYTSATESGIITSTSPMVISLISFFFLRERLSRKQWLGILFAVCGISMIHLFTSETHEIVPGVPRWVGTLLIFGAVIGEALFTIFGKVLSGKLSPLTIATFASLIGFFMFLPFAIVEALAFDFTKPTLSDWMYIVYYAIVITVIGFVLWYYGVSKVPVSTSAVFTGVIAVSALVLSYIFLHERFEWGHLIGIVLVLSGIFITSKQAGKGRSLQDNTKTELQA